MVLRLTDAVSHLYILPAKKPLALLCRTQPRILLAIDRPHGFDSLARGMYSNSLEPFIKHFPPSQILVLRSEDFIDDPSNSFQRIARFLGIDDSLFSSQYFPRHWQMSEKDLFGNGRVNLNFAKDENNDQWMAPLGSHHHHHGHVRGHGGSHVRVPAMAMEDPSIARPATALAKDTPPASENDQVQPDTTIPPNPSEENKELGLSTRYRLQKVFRSLNNRLVDMFESKEKEFSAWEYDVDRG